MFIIDVSYCNYPVSLLAHLVCRTERRRVGESVLPGRAAGEYQCRGVLLMMSYFRVRRYFGASVRIASNFTGSIFFLTPFH